MKIPTNRGSALIVTMLVVAAISAAAFGISRIFLADIRVSGSLEDSIRSYYLAEAGVEEGLLRYRVDRLNEQDLNEIDPKRPVKRTFPTDDGSYEMSTTFLVRKWDTQEECKSEFVPPPGPCENPDADIREEATVETATPKPAGKVTVTWHWKGDASPRNNQCGVELTTVFPNGEFDKVLDVTAGDEASETILYTGQSAIRVKPLCKALDWIKFETERNTKIGKLNQDISSTGTIGRAKRRLVATLSRTSGSIIGFFDFVLGSEGDICRGPC